MRFTRVIGLVALSGTAACGILLSGDDDDPSTPASEAGADTGLDTSPDPDTGTGAGDAAEEIDPGDSGFGEPDVKTGTDAGPFDAGTTNFRIAFVSNLQSAGGFGAGVKGKTLPELEALCQKAADDASFPGRSWTPFLDYTTSTAISRLSTGFAWFRRDGVKIAPGDPKTLATSILNPINLDIDGTSIVAAVWTGHDPDSVAPSNCADWTSGTVKKGAVGNSGSAAQALFAANVPCTTVAHIYCFEK